ncbi:MAG: flagellar motor protein [Sideroxydans sp.]|nr:flagellar motor protein [Sideroxydans sp.]
MDKLSIAGLLVAVLGIIGGQLLEGGDPAFLMQGAAFLIVSCGTLGAVMLQCPSKIFVTGLKMGGWAFVPPELSKQKMVYQITAWSSMARKDGVLALEQQVGMNSDPFLKKGLQLLVDGNSADSIREVLEVEINAFEHLRFSSARIWESAAGYSPTIGILGAVLGLVHVMQNLSEPAKLGDGIAVAFIATIYGVGLANLVFLPISNKLKLIVLDQVAQREMVVEGLCCIANGDNPRLIESKLQGYIT